MSVLGAEAGLLAVHFALVVDDELGAEVVVGVLDVARARVAAAARVERVWLGVRRVGVVLEVALLGLVVEELDGAVEHGRPVLELLREAVALEDVDEEDVRVVVEELAVARDLPVVEVGEREDLRRISGGGATVLVGGAGGAEGGAALPLRRHVRGADLDHLALGDGWEQMVDSWIDGGT